MNMVCSIGTQYDRLSVSSLPPLEHLLIFLTSYMLGYLPFAHRK